MTTSFVGCSGFPVASPWLRGSCRLHRSRSVSPDRVCANGAGAAMQPRSEERRVGKECRSAAAATLIMAAVAIGDTWAIRRAAQPFQAEDGIRDLTVTGVQTCALPIYDNILCWLLRISRRLPLAPGFVSATSEQIRVARQGVCQWRRRCNAAEIGRASCRERV